MKRSDIIKAHLCFKRFASPECTKFMTDSGLGNHPEMIRFFLNIAKAMEVDSFPIRLKEIRRARRLKWKRQ